MLGVSGFLNQSSSSMSLKQSSSLKSLKSSLTGGFDKRKSKVDSSSPPVKEEEEAGEPKGLLNILKSNLKKFDTKD
tara:strand:- start:260 stop:487 length:228 start_codon:yes stop_codon:yes gene_type:complete